MQITDGRPSVTSRPHNDAPINPLLLGAWFALIAGLGDALFGFIAFVVMHRYVQHLPPQLVWLSPASNIVLFAVPGLILWALSRWRPASFWPFASVIVFGFISAAGLTTHVASLHPAAAAILSLGIAVQTARLIVAHPAGARRLIRYTLPLMAAVAIIGGLAQKGLERLAEKRMIGELPPAAQGSPNILLIILDTVRAASLSLYGYSRPTSPALEEFAKRGVTFDLAISPAPWTLPSHATLFTGRWPHELTANWRAPLDDAYPTLAEVMAEHGYLTSGFVANRVYTSRESGLARGFQHYDDVRYTAGQVILSSALGRFLISRTPLPRWVGFRDVIGRKRAINVNAELLDWLHNTRGNGRPFFAFLNYFDAHYPYTPPAPFDTLFDKQRFPSDPGIDSLRIDPAAMVSETAAYDEALAALDHQIGLLLAQLAREGALKNTIVIVTSDHGEEFGEHGVLRHGKTLYMQVTHVPLVIAFDGRVPSGARVSSPVSLRDVPTTLIDLAHVSNQSARSAPALPGRSLSRFWTDSPARGDTILSEVRFRPNRPRREPRSKGDLASIVVDYEHLIRGGDGVLELYELNTDLDEKRNVASHPDARDRVQRLAAALAALIPFRVRH